MTKLGIATALESGGSIKITSTPCLAVSYPPRVFPQAGSLPQLFFYLSYLAAYSTEHIA